MAPKRVLSKFHAKSPTVPFPAAWNFLRPWMCSGSRAESNGPCFRDFVSRYHYLGYAMPFGARLQYLVYVNRPRREVVGCLQFSSPAWRMKARDRWIGWSDSQREAGLQQIVNNSRFLILAPIRNLASTMLSCTPGSVEIRLAAAIRHRAPAG